MGVRGCWEFGTLEREMSSRQLNIHIKREVGLGVSNTEADSSSYERAWMRSFRGDE